MAPTKTQTFRRAKYIDPKTGKMRRVLARKVEVPVAALELVEDIAALKLVETLLKSVQFSSIADDMTERDRDISELVLRRTIELVGQWHRYARRKLAAEYLAP